MASVDGVRNLDLKASIVNGADRVLVHTQNRLLRTKISGGKERREYEDVHANTVGPSRPLTQSSVIPEGQIHPIA